MPGAWLLLNRGGWTWRIDPVWRELLDDARSPDWTHLGREPRATRVKSGEARAVWRVDAGNNAFYAKIVQSTNFLARWRRRLFGSDADRECRIASDASSRGIDTVRPIAAGEGTIDSRPASILITLGLRDARPLMDFWSALDDRRGAARRVKNDVIDATAGLVARAHARGFLHDDLHAGNVLIQTTGERHRPVFVDLQNVHLKRRVSDDEAIVNLVQLNQWFRFHAAVIDRVRFFERYLHWRKALGLPDDASSVLHGDRRALLHRLDPQVAEHARTLNAKRDRRVLREGRYFAALRLADHWRAHVFLETKHPVAGSMTCSLRCTRDQWRAWLTQPARLAAPRDPGAVLKSSASVTVNRATLPMVDGPPVEIICKRSRRSSFLKRLPFVPSRAMRSWRRGHALLHRRIPTACPLAVVERRRLGLLLDSLLITERVPGQDLDTLLTLGMRAMQPPELRSMKRELCTSLAAALRALWENGYTHDDLKATNVIVQEQALPGGPVRIFLIDLDGLRADPQAGREPDLDLLARLNVSVDHCKRVSLADRARFLKAIVRRLGGRPDRWRQAWRDIARRSDVIRAHRDAKHVRNLKEFGRI